MPTTLILTQDINGVAKAYNDFNAQVIGKTITSGGYRSDGEVFLNFSDNSSLIV